MAITTNLETKALVMVFDAGIVDGKQKTKTRTISRTNSEATDEAYYNTAHHLARLQKDDLLKVNKREITAIYNE